MLRKTQGDEEPESEKQSPAEWQQGFWFDADVYKEWLTFMQSLWNSIEYL
jgi:hypothetical protein